MGEIKAAIDASQGSETNRQVQCFVPRFGLDRLKQVECNFDA